MHALLRNGIDSFAAAHDDTGRALSPTHRVRNVIEEIEIAGRQPKKFATWARANSSGLCEIAGM